MTPTQAVDTLVTSMVEKIVHDVQGRLATLRDALDSVENAFEHDAAELESAIAELRQDVAEDADSVEAAHAAVARLASEARMPEGEEEATDDSAEAGEGQHGGDAATAASLGSSLAGALAALRTSATASGHALADLARAVDVTIDQAEQVSSDTSAALSHLLAQCETASTALKESIDAAHSQLDTHVKTFGLEAASLIAFEGERLKTAMEQCLQLTSLIEATGSGLAQRTQDLLTTAKQATDQWMAQQLSSELGQLGRQVKYACGGLANEASQLARQFDGDIGETMRKLNEIADLLDKIKPLVEAIDALL